jgi:AcrR family transcriptional regulator
VLHPTSHSAAALERKRSNLTRCSGLIAVACDGAPASQVVAHGAAVVCTASPIEHAGLLSAHPPLLCKQPLAFMSSRPPLSHPARERLLAAAARVFAREGLTGATTRAIAREAGVNEVTLFRLFRTKQRLLDAVVQENFGAAAPATTLEPPPDSADLRADLFAHARHYERMLHDNLPLIRAMIGEIHHHGDHERKVFRAIFRPVRVALIARLQLAQEARLLRRTIDPVILSDLFGGMIFTGVLRRASADVERVYSAADYLATAVDLVLRGAAA